MKRTMQGKRRPGALLLVMGVAAASLAFLPSAGAQTGPTGIASPATEIQDQQWVKLEWTGLPLRPKTSTQRAINRITYRQCTANPTDVLRDCYRAIDGFNAEVIPDSSASADGNGAQFLPVEELDAADPIQCDFEHPCTLVAFGFDTNEFLSQKVDHLDFARAAKAPIVFGRTSRNCTVLGGGPRGEGDPSGFLAMLTWLGKVCADPYLIDAENVLKTSFLSLESFVAQDETAPDDDIDFAITNVPLTDEQKATLTEKKIGYAVVPITLSGVALGTSFNNLVDFESAGRALDIRLTPELIAMAMTGELSRTDPIRSVQKTPSGRFNTNLRTYKPAGAATETRALTTWLATYPEAVAAWLKDTRLGTLPTDAYPSAQADNTIVTGSKELARQIGNRISYNPTNGSETIVGTNTALLGWMDTSLAAFYGLPMAELPNRNPVDNPGSAPDFEFVAPTVASLTKGAEAALAKDTSGDAFLKVDYSTAAPGAYPMPVITYMVARTDLAAKGEEALKRGQDLKKLLEYILVDGQKVLPGGYAPLPAALVTRAQELVKKIKTEAPVPTPSPSPKPEKATEEKTPKASPSPTPIPEAAAEASSTPSPSPSASPSPEESPSAAPIDEPPATTAPEPDPAPVDRFSSLESEDLGSGSGSDKVTTNDSGVEGDFTDAAETANTVEDIPVEEASPVTVARSLARAVGLLEPSKSRYLLPLLAIVGLLSLVYGSAHGAPTVLRGWNPTFETDLRRHFRDLVDRRREGN